jgi:hypothetical protein
MAAKRSKRVRDAHRIACPSCSAVIVGQHCSACGELRADRRHDGLGHLVLDLFESLTHVDGKIFRSLRALFLRPGELTVQYLRGARKLYMSPMHVFVVANIVYFLVQSWLSWKSLTTPLATQLHLQFYSEFAREHLAAFLAQNGLEYETVAPRFDAAVRVYAKSLVFLMVPLFALGSALVCIPRTRSALTQLVAALHLYAAFLCFHAVIVGPLATALVAWRGPERSEAQVDNWVTSLMLVAFTLYNTGVLRRVFGFGWISAVLRALALALVFAAVLLAYRFLLFLIVLHTADFSGR